MDLKTNRIVEDIQTKCIKLSTCTEIDAFYEYAPHVQTLAVTIFLKGWHDFSRLNFPKDYEFSKRFYMYLDDHVYENYFEYLEECNSYLDFLMSEKFPV